VLRDHPTHHRAEAGAEGKAMTTMTVQQADRILAALKGNGWTKVQDIRERAGWRSAETPELTSCIRALKNRGLVRTTRRGWPDFRVCLAAEAGA